MAHPGTYVSEMSIQSSPQRQFAIERFLLKQLVLVNLPGSVHMLLVGALLSTYVLHPKVFCPNCESLPL